MAQDPGTGPLKKVTLLQAGDRSDGIYDEWAGDYEADLLHEFGYNAHAIAAAALVAELDDRSTPIIDFGSGTGLVGAELHRLGCTTIDGVDYSPGMLDVCRANGVYRDLIQADLTDSSGVPDGGYGAMVCVGVMGAGHLVPEDFGRLFNAVAPGGPIVLFGNGTPYADDNYASRFASLDWTIQRTEFPNYMEALDRPGALIVGCR